MVAMPTLCSWLKTVQIDLCNERNPSPWGDNIDKIWAVMLASDLKVEVEALQALGTYTRRLETLVPSA